MNTAMKREIVDFSIKVENGVVKEIGKSYVAMPEVHFKVLSSGTKKKALILVRYKQAVLILRIIFYSLILILLMCLIV